MTLRRGWKAVHRRGMDSPSLDFLKPIDDDDGLPSPLIRGAGEAQKYCNLTTNINFISMYI